MKIKAPRNNGVGDVGIGREFRGLPDQQYTATATVSMINVTESGNENQLYARLTIIPISNQTGQIAECNSPLKVSKDTADSPGEVLVVPDCVMPGGTDKVAVRVRLKSLNLNSGATLIVHDLNFRRTQ